MLTKQISWFKEYLYLFILYNFLHLVRGLRITFYLQQNDARKLMCMYRMCGLNMRCVYVWCLWMYVWCVSKYCVASVMCVFTGYLKFSTIKQMILESSKLTWINLTLKIKGNRSISSHYPTKIQGNIPLYPSLKQCHLVNYKF